MTTSADQSSCIWKTQDFSLYRQFSYSSGQRWVWDAAFTNDSQYLITGFLYIPLFLKIFEVKLKRNKLLFLASSDGIARLWNIESGEIEREYSGHQKAITALAFVDCIPA